MAKDMKTINAENSAFWDELTAKREILLTDDDICKAAVQLLTRDDQIPDVKHRKDFGVLLDDAEAVIKPIKPEIESGRKYKKEQSDKAQRKRPTKNESGETLDNVIAELARNHPDERPSEIWPHLKQAIEEWCGEDCLETKMANPESCSYQFRIGEKVDTISYGVFRKKLGP